MNKYEAQKKLEQKQEELQRRLKNIESDLKKGRSRDWEDQAQERENDEVLDGLAVEAKGELQRVQKALVKIANDTYGICSECGNPIEAQRLDAVADAEQCSQCA